MRLYVSNLLSSMQFLRVALLKLPTMCLKFWSVTSFPTLRNFLVADLIFKIKFHMELERYNIQESWSSLYFELFNRFRFMYEELCMIIMRFKKLAITISLIKFMKDSTVNVLLVAYNNSIRSELNTTIKLASK